MFDKTETKKNFELFFSQFSMKQHDEKISAGKKLLPTFKLNEKESLAFELKVILVSVYGDGNYYKYAATKFDCVEFDCIKTMTATRKKREIRYRIDSSLRILQLSYADGKWYAPIHSVPMSKQFAKLLETLGAD